jgi:hypothetical protein
MDFSIYPTDPSIYFSEIQCDIYINLDFMILLFCMPFREIKQNENFFLHKFSV